MPSAEYAVRQIMSVLFERDIGPAEKVERQLEPLWDSLHHVELLLALEGSFNLRFDEDELQELDTAAKILASVRRHQDGSR
jgi:acyl carrier protein